MKPKLCLALILTLSLPALSIAQQPENVDPAELMRRMQQNPEAMQKMAREAEAAQKCMQDIDQKQIDALQKKAEAASREIEALCEEGKRDEALAKALALSREMRDDATVKKIRACTKPLGDMMKGMPWARVPGVQDEPDPTENDICS